MSEFIDAYKALYAISQKIGAGDPYSYARSREIYIAEVLGHKVADTYSGADGYDKQGNPVEYKSTIDGKIKGTYNGISVQPTLKEQIQYIKEEKIGKYKKHYMARFDGPDIVELYEMDVKDVLEILLPKIEKDYLRKTTKKSKDPRIGVNLTYKEIYKYGKKII